jgi:hypothetical protein
MFLIDLGKEEARRRRLQPRDAKNIQNPLAPLDFEDLLWPAHERYMKDKMAPLGSRIVQLQSPANTAQRDNLVHRIMHVAGLMEERSIESGFGQTTRSSGPSDDFLEEEDSAWLRRRLMDDTGRAVEVSEVAGPINLKQHSSTASPARSRPMSASRGAGSSIKADAGDTMSWRLATIYRDVRVCVPGNVDLLSAPSPVVADADDRSVAYASVKDALAEKIAGGGGAIYFEAPVVGVRLCEDIAAECSESIGPDGWPMYARGAVLGAVLYIIVETTTTFVCEPGELGITFQQRRPGVVASVTEGGQAEAMGIKKDWVFKQLNSDEFSDEAFKELKNGSVSYTVTVLKDIGDAHMRSTSDYLSSRWSVSTAGDGRSQGAMPEGIEEHPPQIVHGDGFRLRIIQGGGPRVDPSRIHIGGRKDGQLQGWPTSDQVASEIDRWAGKPLGTRPSTWRTLHLTTASAATESGAANPLEASQDETSRRSAFHLTTSIAGNAGGLDVVLAATATVEVVLEPFELGYGDSHCTNMKHMFEAEVADLLKVAPEQVMCGDFGVVGQKRNAGAGRKHVRKSTVMLTFAILHSEMVEVRTRLQTLRDPGKSLSAKLAATFKRSQLELSSTGAIPMNANSKSASPLKKAFSTNSLTGSHALPDLQVTPPGPDLRGLSMALARTTNAGLQPDLLLRKLMAALGAPRHAMRRHADVFPMANRVIKGGLNTGAMLVANTEVVTPGRICDSLNDFMKGQKPPGKSHVQLDDQMHADFAQRRKGVISTSEGPAGGDDEIKAKFQEFRVLSPKELLDRMESSLALPNDMAACLEVLIVWTQTDVDAQGNPDQCIKLKYHNIFERLQTVMHHFKSVRPTMHSVITIASSLTMHDVGCVDRILEKLFAPGLMTVLENFPADHPMQAQGVAMLRRIYQRARETALHGPRFLTLGKGLDQVWTFRGVDRILEAMERFEYDQDLQLDACKMLMSLAEQLPSTGKAALTFDRVRNAMSRYSHRADIARCGAYIFGRLGPRFLAQEHRGVRLIVDAMERHRSDVEMQRAGARAFFALSKTEDALKVCRNGGGIGAMLISMFAHSSDSQVLQESTRALEKHCPVSLSRVFAVCGDLKETLPPVYWRHDPLDLSGKTNFSASDMKDVMIFEKVDTIDTFLSEMMSLSPGSGARTSAAVSDYSLDTIEGYRRLGLRDELDALDDLCALPGPASTGLSTTEPGTVNPQLKKDLQRLQKVGCDGNHLLVPGPKEPQLKRLVEELQSGAKRGTKWGANDGELLVLLLGLFAWHSPLYALKMVGFGAAKALVAWLRADHLECGRSIADEADRYPLQRACIGAIASMARHGGECVEELLKEGAAPLVLSFTKHLNISIKRNAVRCVARMLPHAPRGGAHTTFAEKDVWKLVLTDLADKDDTVRTCAAACALEAVSSGWTQSEDTSDLPDMENLVEVLLRVLQTRTPNVGDAPTNLQSGGALPVLLTMARLVDEDSLLFLPDDRRRKVEEQLLRWLRRWLPAASSETATSLDRAAASGAAKALEAMSKKEAPLKSEDMEALLKYGSSDTATVGFWEACLGALEPAILREGNVEVLGQLFSTRVPRTGGAKGLAKALVLDNILQRILTLLRNDSTRMSDRLVKSLESVEDLLPNLSDETAGLHHAFNEVRNFGLSAEEREKKRVPTEDHMGTIPSGK